MVELLERVGPNINKIAWLSGRVPRPFAGQGTDKDGILWRTRVVPSKPDGLQVLKDFELVMERVTP